MEPFVYRRRVQFAETDMAGVMHFSNYFRLMEEAEHEFWRSLGLSVHMLDRAPGVSWPRVRVSCEYTAPARFEDDLEIAVRLARVGGRSLDFEVEFLRDGRRIAAGRMTVVCCRYDEGGFRSVEIPASIRAVLPAVVA